MRADIQKKIYMCAHDGKKYFHERNLLHMFAKLSAHFCKMSKMCRAQNAQICSANYFPNATFPFFTNLHCAQFVCASFRRVHNLFLLCENFSAHIKKIITISRKNLRSLKKLQH